MAKRKRLTPAQGDYLASPALSAGPASLGPAPIASVAGEAASAAALAELSQAMQAARDEGRLIEALPIEAIAAGHLVRDRIALDEDEIITAIRIPRPAKAGYAKFPQPASLFAMVGVFAAETGGAARVAITGAGEDGVFRHAGLEAALANGWSADALSAVEIAADGLLSDIHGDAAYRANLIKVMAKKAVSA